MQLQWNKYSEYKDKQSKRGKNTKKIKNDRTFYQHVFGKN